MRKAFFLLALPMFLMGCHGYKFHLFPTTYVTVVNDCRGSILTTNTTWDGERQIPYGGKTVIALESHMGRNSNMMLLVRGRNVRGEHLGSADQSFYVGNSSVDERIWRVQYLTGGLGCEPEPRRRSLLETIEVWLAGVVAE